MAKSRDDREIGAPRTGAAEPVLRWEMGIRPGVTPLLAYRSGDLQMPAQLRDH